YDAVDAVDEFGGKLAPGRFQAGPGNLFRQTILERRRLFGWFGCGESPSRTQNGTDFDGAEVAGHKDQGLREIDPAIVAERQRGLVQDAQQQLPEGIAGLLDL